MVLQPVVNPTLHLLLPRRILNTLRQWTRCKVEMHKLARVSILRPHLTPDPMAPIATLHHVLRVPKLLHKLIEQARSVLQRPTRARRPVGHRLRDHRRGDRPGGQSEKQKPGKLGTTTWNAGSLGSVGWDSGPQTELNSQKEPGQPWHMMRGIASLRSERAWTKWSLTSSMSVV